MSSRDVPEPWAKLLTQARLVDPRNGLPSMSRLAEESGVHASTISAMMYGDRRTRPASVDKVSDTIAARLRITNPDVLRSEIARWVGQALGDERRFEPHPDADLLSPQERKAVNELIRLLAAPKRLAQSQSSGVLSVVPDEVDDAVAAHEEEVPTAGEQEESDTP